MHFLLVQLDFHEAVVYCFSRENAFLRWGAFLYFGIYVFGKQPAADRLVDKLNGLVLIEI
jgi:hypothetical protein